MVAKSKDLWTLVRGTPQIDPNDLARAVQEQAQAKDLDYRTKLLIRDSVDALERHWGPKRTHDWLVAAPTRVCIESIRREEFDKVGFPSIGVRLMEKTDPEVVRQFLDHVGRKLRADTRIYVAGSIALILPGLLSRHTEDVDVIDEVPEEIRENHELLAELESIYGLHLGHVQSHYFPMGWQNRAQSFADCGRLSVYLADPIDVFLSKLFSARVKDMGDMRVLAPQLDKQVIIRRFLDTCCSFMAAPRLKQIAEDNWHILFGEDLPQ